MRADLGDHDIHVMVRKLARFEIVGAACYDTRMFRRRLICLMSLGLCVLTTGILGGCSDVRWPDYDAADDGDNSATGGSAGDSLTASGEESDSAETSASTGDGDGDGDGGSTDSAGTTGSDLHVR